MDRKGLQRAQKAVQAVLKDAEASWLFGAPVDLQAFPHYTSIVQEAPADLGSIAKDLAASLRAGGGGPYQHPAQVLAAASRCWRNARTFNAGVSDILAIVDRVEALFTAQWAAQGLGGGGDGQAAAPSGSQGAAPAGRPVDPAEVPPGYELREGG